MINPVQSDVVEREEIMYNHVETVSLCKWGKNVDTYTTLNDALVRLFRDVMDLEERSSEDRRVVYISLPEKGRRAYRHHEDFHRRMIDAVLDGLTPDETDSLVKALAKLDRWFRGAKA